MKKIACIACSVLLLLSMTLGLAGCGAAPADPPQEEGTTVAKTGNLMEGVVAQTPDVEIDLASNGAVYTDFAVRLFQAGQVGGENSLISPLSVLCALAMTANGAKGETRAQMEAVLGMKAEDLNAFLFAYMKDLPCDEKYKLSLANSIWFTDDDSFRVNTNFLQTNADYFGADLYKAPFNDATCNAINDWVKDKTDGMIPRILDQIPSDAVMYLINALAFEAEWAEVYRENNVSEGVFTREDGSRIDVTFMYSQEGDYLETNNATGFIKYYTGGQYAFVALLPNEGVSVAELVNSLSGAELNRLLLNPQNAHVNAAMPKFETGFSAEMSDTLAGMGMPLAFDGDKADFTGLGTADENIYISRVIHKTFISVAEQGTKAGAATVVEMAKNTSIGPIPEVKTVHLDRPFVYMLVDMRTGTPFFIGTLMNPAA